jgi:hypothetical protein
MSIRNSSFIIIIYLLFHVTWQDLCLRGYLLAIVGVKSESTLDLYNGDKMGKMWGSNDTKLTFSLENLSHFL